jgi:hypothetical protein
MSTLVIRRDIFQLAGCFAEEPQLREDRDLYLRIAPRSTAVAVPEMLARIREHSQRTTTQMAAPHERTALVFERFLASGPEASLATLARNSWTRELANAGAMRLADRQLVVAAKLFGRALVNGGSLKHGANALLRGLKPQRGP